MKVYRVPGPREPFAGVRIFSDVLMVIAILMCVFVTGIQVGIWWQREHISYKIGVDSLPPPTD